MSTNYRHDRVCPECGKYSIVYNGTMDSGKQKYRCTNCGKNGVLDLHGMSVRSVLARMQTPIAIRGIKLLHPELKEMIRCKFHDELTPMAVPTVYACTIYKFLTVTKEQLYRTELPPESWRMLELWRPFFRYVANYGLVDDSRQFNELIAGEMMKVYADESIAPIRRVQMIYAAGNVLYMIQLLEDMADLPFQNDTNDQSTCD